VRDPREPGWKANFLAMRRGPSRARSGKKWAGSRKPMEATVFLDEIGDMSRPSRRSCSDSFEDGSLPAWRNEELRVDVRLIAAQPGHRPRPSVRTSFARNLFTPVKRRATLPAALARAPERRADSGAPFFADVHCNDNRSVRGITPAAQDKLLALTGGQCARNCGNVMERAVILETSEEVQSTSLPMFQIETRLRKDRASNRAGQSAHRRCDVRI